MPMGGRFEKTDWLDRSPTTPPGISMYWCMLIEEYSLSSLPFGMDKLPAILGISQMFHAKHTGLGQYVAAGLWSGDLVRGLCWSPSLLQSKQRRKIPGYKYNDGLRTVLEAGAGGGPVVELGFRGRVVVFLVLKGVYHALGQ